MYKLNETLTAMRTLFLLLTLLSSLPLLAQKVKKVEGEYVYHAPENVTLEEAKRTALERAKIQAIANEFNTLVTQDNETRVRNRNGQAEIDFLSVGGSEVKGEWIETIGEPDYAISLEGGHFIVTCKVKGKAREIVSSAVDFKAHILRNGIADKFESKQFKEGDYLYLSFQSPVKGYLAVYLEDADGQVFCLLPYRNQQEGIYPIEANRRYIFFDTKSVPETEKPLVDEYYMTCSRSSEFNQIHIIFSPNEFTKAADNTLQDKLPRQLSLKDFHKWLSKCQRHDTKMNVKPVGITIQKGDI